MMNELIVRFVLGGAIVSIVAGIAELFEARPILRGDRGTFDGHRGDRPFFLQLCLRRGIQE
jgi:hypothetical protein